MPQLLLITHRASGQPGGPSARWRSLVRSLPRAGWEVEVLSAPSHTTSDEFASAAHARNAVARRARVMSILRRAATPLFALIGTRPPPLSTLWLARGVRAARHRVRREDCDVVLATAPPMVALVVARLAVAGSKLPLVIELRDLWAGNPAYDCGGRALNRLEAWILRRAQAIVVCTPEAAADLIRRHPEAADRVRVITNGFEHELLAVGRARHRRAGDTLEILHSGTLTTHRPLTPLLAVLRREPYRSRFRLVLHGYVVPELIREVGVAAHHCDVELIGPSGWDDAVARIAKADVALVTQAASAGDATAVASKVYEYLALGKPVLCLTDGGATEALLRRLGADRWRARLQDELGICAALDDLMCDPCPPPVSADILRPYDRTEVNAEMVDVLNGLVSRAPNALILSAR